MGQLLNAVRLLLHRRRDLLQHVGNLVDRFGNLAAAAGLFLGGADDALDLFGGADRAVGDLVQCLFCDLGAFNLFINPFAADLHGFDAEMVEIVAEPNALITRKPLSKLDPSYYGKIIIGAIFRDGEWRVAVGDTQINDNERAIVVCKSLSLKDVQQLFFA